jgi:hypothetical protein
LEEFINILLADGCFSTDDILKMIVENPKNLVE